MAYSISSKVAELLDNPGPRAIIDKHIPDMASNPQIGMARGMSLKMVASMSGGRISKAILDAVDADLQKL